MAAVPRAASVKRKARAPTTLMAVAESPVLRSVNTVEAVRVQAVNWTILQVLLRSV